MTSVSFLTFEAPSFAIVYCRAASSPSVDSILLSRSSTFFGEIFSRSAMTMRESFTSPSASILGTPL